MNCDIVTLLSCFPERLAESIKSITIVRHAVPQHRRESCLSDQKLEKAFDQRKSLVRAEEPLVVPDSGWD